MNPDLRSLIALQDIELKIASIQKQISEIPRQVEAYRQELQRLEQIHRDRVVQLQEDTKRRRTFEGEVDVMRARLSKLKDQLMMVKTNKEYTAMLHEIQMAEAQRLIEETRIGVLLSGIRGQPAADLEALARALAALSHLLVQFPRIEEVDLNPVRVFPGQPGLLALDARIRLTRAD